MEKKWPSPPFRKRKLGPPNKESPHEFEIFSGASYKIRKKDLAPHKKKYLWVGGGVYTMKYNNTNTDYHKLVRLGDQKREIVEITIGLIFFCLR